MGTVYIYIYIADHTCYDTIGYIYHIHMIPGIQKGYESRLEQTSTGDS